MIIQLGLLLATYVGSKIYQNITTKKTVTDDQPAPTKNSQAMVPTQAGVADQNRKHYVKSSLVTMGLFALSPLYPILFIPGIGMYLYSSVPYMRDVEQALLKDKKINADVLFFFGDSLTFGLGQYFTATVGLWLMNLGKLAVDKAKDNSQDMITEIFAQLPDKVWVLQQGVEIEIALEAVKTDDILVVNAGGVIPVDGRIIQGMASIDQHMLTGESQPVEKKAGDEVHANTVILSGNLHIRVERSGEQTTAAKIQDLLAHSTDFKSSLQLKGEKWANTATLPMFVGACAILPVMGVVPSVVFIQAHIGKEIRVLTTIATLLHILHAARKGILVKDGRVLESLHEIDTFLFDKTGTLTQEQPQVRAVIACDSFNEQQVIRYAAIAEQKQTHPIAQAILAYAQTLQVDDDDEAILNAKYKMGYGLTVFLDQQTIRVGSDRFLQSEGLEISAELQQVQRQSHDEGHTMIFVAVDDQVAGAIELEPHLRPEAKATIDQLKTLGIKHFAIVSGDHDKPTQKLADALGIDEYFAQVLPEEKAKIVEDLQKQGRKVCFVGDGINDAIAMKTANVSISLQGATNLAQDVADTVLLDPNLTLICDLYQFSQSLDKNLRRSLSLTLLPSAINLGGAFFWNFSILGAKGLSIAFNIVAELNALQPPKDLRQDNSFLDKLQDGYQILRHDQTEQSQDLSKDSEQG